MGAEEKDEDFGFDMKMEISFGLSSAETEMEMSFEGETESETETIDYDDPDVSGDEPKFIDVATNAKYILWAGIALSAVFIALAFVEAAGLLARGGARHIPLVMGLVAFIIVITALAYFTAVFPGALHEDIDIDDLGDMGNEKYGFALILGFVASIVLLVGAVISRRPVTPMVAGAFPGTYGPPPGQTAYAPPPYEPAQPAYQVPEAVPAAPSAYDTSSTFGAPVAPTPDATPGTTYSTSTVQGEVTPPAAPVPGVCPSCGSNIGPTDQQCPICLARL